MQVHVSNEQVNDKQSTGVLRLGVRGTERPKR